MMTTLPPPLPLTLQLEPIVRLSDDELFEFCAINRDLHIERTTQGDLVVMSPAGGETSDRNAEITLQLGIWAKRDGTGRVFDSSGGFILPSGAMRAPDAAWVERSRLRDVAPDRRQKFLPLCPTFVIELRSSSDALPPIQKKMEEYLAGGAALGWLVDPTIRRVFIYRPDQEVEILEDPNLVSGDPVLPGFAMEMEEIWNPPW